MLDTISLPPSSLPIVLPLFFSPPCSLFSISLSLSLSLCLSFDRYLEGGKEDVAFIIRGFEEEDWTRGLVVDFSAKRISTRVEDTDTHFPIRERLSRRQQENFVSSRRRRVGKDFPEDRARRDNFHLSFFDRGIKVIPKHRTNSFVRFLLLVDGSRSLAWASSEEKTYSRKGRQIGGTILN